MGKERKSISSDLKRLDKMTDADIDYSDSPPLDDSFFEKAMVGSSAKRKNTSADVDKPNQEN